MTKTWNDRTQYGVIIKKLIQSQVKKYNQTKDSHLKIKFVTSISNLVNTQNSMINDYEGRIDLKRVDEILKENASLHNEISVRSQRNSHNYLDSKQQKEQEKFLKLSTAEQKEFQKKCELKSMEKREARGQTYSEILP